MTPRLRTEVEREMSVPQSETELGKEVDRVRTEKLPQNSRSFPGIFFFHDQAKDNENSLNTDNYSRTPHNDPPPSPLQ